MAASWFHRGEALGDLGFGVEILWVLLAAVAGGLAARSLRLPVIIGYLAGGLAVGPFGLGLVRDVDTVDALATIGVILLLFTIGLEFSLRELRRTGPVAIFGGIAQILVTALAGFGLALLLGWTVTEAIFFGFLISLSSTTIVLKTLLDRGELDTAHGRIMMGILLVQDLSLVPLMIILPTLGGDEGSLLATLGLAAFKAAVFVGVMLLLGLWGLPRLLRRVAGGRSRELFLLTVVSLTLAAAFGAFFLGLSAAVGAFIAGLLIGQSTFARQAFADIVPLRDIFVAVFFVSLGMLADPAFTFNNLGTIATLVLSIIAIKFVILTVIPWLFGHNARASLFTGLGLVQIGEFSFVLAGVGLVGGIISQHIYSLTLAAAAITMVLTPFTLKIAPLLYHRLSRGRRFTRLIAFRGEQDWGIDACPLSAHAIICGHGRVGSIISRVLDRRNLSYLVIESDPIIIAGLRARGVPNIYGDSSNPEILAHACLDKARVLICTFPDFIEVELTVRNARQFNPKLDIVARVHRDADAEVLKGIGASELVRPEFEASLEVTRHTLHRFGVPTLEIQRILNSLRQGGLF
jgi:CPA2 family monovalent cation:H+ antiporter-2